MRIGIVIPELVPAHGGLSQWCWRFILALVEREHEPVLFTQLVNACRLPHQVEVHLVPRTKSRIKFAEAAACLVKKQRLDLVHDMGGGWECDFLQPHGGSHCAWLARKRAMHPPWLRPLKQLVDPLLPRYRDYHRHAQLQFGSHSKARQFVAISHFVAADMIRVHGVSPKLIEVVYNGVDCHRFSPTHRQRHRGEMRRYLNLAHDTTLLMLAAHNFRLKGLHQLLSALERLVAHQRNLHLLVAGGRKLGNWQRYVNRRQLTKYVTFVGHVDDLRPYFAAADVYAQPTYYDPCSLVLLEAAASGLPIVSTRRFNGAAELFREGLEILTVHEPNDVAGLCDRIVCLMNADERHRLGQAARAVALRNTFEDNVTNILNLYERRLPRQRAA